VELLPISFDSSMVVSRRAVLLKNQICTDLVCIYGTLYCGCGP